MHYSVEDSLKAWEANAEFWDNAMGEDSNEFHRRTVRPMVTRLLDPRPGEYILDIACGNGNYSAYLAQQGVRVRAFDYSPAMIALAKKRQAQFGDQIEFSVTDATDAESLAALKGPFTKAVSNMALMDMTRAAPLFRSVHTLLAEGGIFVFATQHPCFVTLTEQYMTPHAYRGEAILGQPQKQCYYHRSMQDILNLCFDSGFVVDGFSESCFRNPERPEIIIVRARKV